MLSDARITVANVTMSRKSTIYSKATNITRTGRNGGGDHILCFEADDINGQGRIGFHIKTPFGEDTFLIILSHEKSNVNKKPAETGMNCRERPPNAPHVTSWTGAAV